MKERLHYTGKPENTTNRSRRIMISCVVGCRKQHMPVPQFARAR